MNLRPTRLDSGIFLISFAVLLVELSLTRIFSVTLYYHLSFMVVSLAMLGFGAGGLIINLWPSFFRADRMWGQLAAAAMLFALTSTLVVGVAFNLPVSLDASRGNLVRLALLYMLCVIPFLTGGLLVALILTHRTEQANRLYFFDLVGASLGCLLFIPLTNWLGAPTAVLAGATCAALSAVVLAGRDAPNARRIALALACVLLLACVANRQWNFYDVRVTKGRAQPPMLALGWNSFSRVEVLGTPDEMTTQRPPLSRGFSKNLPPDIRTTELRLRYDAGALTQIARFDGDISRFGYLRYDVASAPYQMRAYHNILVLGAGGGRDILTALNAGNRRVTGVEINPLTIELMRGKFREFTGGLYDGYPGVRIVNDEGRTFLRGEREPYDLIQASLVDTWAATTAGAYALTENNLYTVEAFGDYLRHLTPEGVIAFSRWFPAPPVEPLRVVTLAVEALRRDGAQNPSAHVFVVRTNSPRVNLSTTLVKRTPFDAGELERLRAWADEMDFVVAYAPDDAERGVVPDEFHQLLSPRSAEFIAAYPYDISAVYDDRPFFFDRVPLTRWLAHRFRIARTPVGAGSLTLGGQSLFASLIISALCTVLLLLLPFVAARSRRTHAVEHAPGDDDARMSRRRALLYALYFACLGLGFIMVEIVLIQRFNLFFGYPVYSLSVVLFTILLASGLGSVIAGRWAEARNLRRALIALCVLLLLYAAALPVLLDALLGESTPARIVIAVALIAPLGILLGMPFPTGLRFAGRESKSLVSWAWAANGVASVFGSTLAVLISMTYGFDASFLTGAGAYLLALVLISSLQMQFVVNRES